ncbi:disease resistance protein RUN1-like [Rosa rugosa]|uniref:disease resistance protein RUN1-like n=1 Tax=Rosa rugosa TaxID=74645 RepID=UPI002B411E37|nr:disease resistance protein RUN1-like [Rosa rugosa]XP_062026308.1 disease resistance protein RUN1-like [Rosa rugosa]
MASSYDVFLSFRGPDTRNNFTSHLHSKLVASGIHPFIDDEELERGEEISPSLIRGIEGCRISLIVFSANYASSKWCLDELVKIMECRKTLGHTVFPIFYRVEPSDVRHQTGSFAEAFVQHKAANRSAVKVSRWIAALHEAANLSGFHLSTTSNRGEAGFIDDIVDQIGRRLTNTYLHVADYPIGIDSRVEEISKSLCVGADDDVHMVGIWGMGGIGKTSVAKAIYNKFYRSFEGTSFLANVGETAKQSNGKIILQETLLSDILRPTEIEVGNPDRGIIVIKERLRKRKVLVIVDDVDDVDQLTALAIRHDSFGPGSRIVITTRDQHLLEQLKVSIHLTREMNKEEALELFSWHAFQNYCPDAEFLELSRTVVTYCGGLPLALEVLGSFLFGRKDVRDWKSTLKKLERIPDGKIQKKLKISYDAIDENQKNLFLDVSCFFIGMDKNHVINILEGCGLSAAIDTSVLIQRCLLVVSEKNKLTMHNLLRDMGREVVREQSPEDPEERSRLWCQEDVLDILTEGSGTKEIKGLALNLQRSQKKTFRTQAFRKMKKLKLLQLNYVELIGEYDHLSKNLRWLCWHGFSLKSIGTDFLNQGNLVSMDLQYSNLVQVWEHPRVLKELKILNLSHSHYLTQSPDFSKLPNLEYLIMKGCKSLSEMHQSIGDVKRVALVNLKDCKMLKDLPKNFYKLRGIETLVLSGCSRFENFVEDIGEMTSLKTLAVSGTAISQVPPYIGRLTNLNYSSVQGLVRLKLRFPDVPKNYFPHEYTSLMYCNLEGSNVHNLPQPSGISHLERPCFYNCTHLPASGDLPDHCTALAIIPNSNSSEASRQSILQGLTATGDGGIYLPGNDFPKQFTYVRESDQVFFQVPQTNLQAFAVCVVCSSCFDEDMSPSGISIFVTNYTKRIRFVVKPTPLTEITSHEVIWRVNLLNDQFNLEGDDFVKVEVAIGSGFRVKKTGVSLVWDPKLINENTIECEPIPYKYFPSDADNPAGGHYYNIKSSSSSPLPSYSSSSRHWKYEVFLSFRGEDTGRTFTDHLYAALDRAGVVTFRDAEGLRSEENISEELVRIIQECRISLIIFSENYADSSWCLEELVQILECRKTRGQLAFPVFYYVDSSHVRNQAGSFGKAFKNHEARETEDKISGWRAALTGAANLTGYDTSVCRVEGICIEIIVDKICESLGKGILLVPREAIASRLM